mgnify:CR=1 FL=1
MKSVHRAIRLSEFNLIDIEYSAEVSDTEIVVLCPRITSIMPTGSQTLQ